ncbi:fibulin-7 isoform X2 [Stegostoma tigrinum]|uniref:fibulin-7 isoform X2 n=1 Tax=Stegostoma tigrinum TaxID=3053191 RepID=UPI00202B58A0|nr:fibulin-7 isoform X2 [Stegostoma tigrinum]
MIPAIQHSVFLYLVLSCLYPSHAAQGCLNKQKVLTVIRQMQQFLKGQETHFTDGIRTMKAKLSALQISVTKLTADQPSATWCPLLEAPKHGQKFGSRYSADHEVHFVCQPGYQLIGSSTRVCQQNGRWSGVNASCTEWSDLSFSRKPHCAEVERTQHCSCDAGFHMSGSNENSVCQDVNECEVFQLEGIARLCMYNCINIPGSYRCTCPPAYKLLNDGRSCSDVDECATLQHNCTAGETCINTGGGFQCVNPQCPEPRGNISYVKTSPFQCERHPCPMNSKSCHHAAKTISFHYLSLPSKLKTPVTLFRMATAAAPGRPGPDNLRFGIIGKNNQGQFVVQRSDRQTGELILVQPLKGPCTVEVDVDMSEYRDRTFQSKHVSKVTLFISANGF